MFIPINISVFCLLKKLEFVAGYKIICPPLVKVSHCDFGHKVLLWNYKLWRIPDSVIYRPMGMGDRSFTRNNRIFKNDGTVPMEC